MIKHINYFCWLAASLILSLTTVHAQKVLPSKTPTTATENSTISIYVLNTKLNELENATLPTSQEFSGSWLYFNR